MTQTDGGAERPPEKTEGVWSRVGYAVGGQIVYSLGQLVILASISLLRGAEAVGMFGLALAIVTPIFIFANMGLRTVQAIDQTADFSFEEYSGFRLITTGAALVLACGLGYLFTDHHDAVIWIILLYALAKSLESISELAYGAYERLERFDLVFRSNVIRSVLTALVFVAVLLAGAPLWSAFFAQVLVWGAVALALDLRVSRAVTRASGAVSITWRRFVQLFRRSLPIGGTGFLTGLQPSFLRIFVEAHLGLAALGVFTNISYIFQAGAMLGNAVRHFLGARFSRLRVEGNRGGTLSVIVKIVAAIVLACVFGLLFVMGLGDTFLLYLFGPETAEHGDLLLVVSLALALRLLTSVPTSLVYAYGGTVGQFWRELFFVVTVVALSPILIPQAGLVGAGSLLLIVSAVRFIADTARVIYVLRRRS